MIAGAFGKSSEVLTVNTGSNQVVSSLGTYWYNNPYASFGFTNVPYLNQRSADTYDCDGGLSYCTNSYAMSWHAGGGGWRIGTIIWLNGDYRYVKSLFKLVDSYYC